MSTDPHAPDEGYPTEARSARALHLGIAGFAGVLLVTIIASIHLSTLDVSFGSMLFGAPTVWRGQSASFRLAAYDPRGVELVGPIAATFTLRDHKGDRSRATVGGSSFAEARVPVPGDIAGRCELVVDVETPEGADHISVELEALDEPLPLSGRVASHAEVFPHNRQPTGPLEIAVYPQGGHIVAGLENRVSARVTRNGQPVQIELHTDALGIHTESDAHGILQFPFSPTPQVGDISFTVGSAAGETLDVPLQVESSGLLLEVTPRGFVRPGGDLRLDVSTLPFSDPVVHVDLWVGDALLLASSKPARDRHLDLEIGLPAAARGWVRVEVYRNLGADAAVRSSQLLWVSDKPALEAAADALAALDSLPGGDSIVAVAGAASGEERVEMTRMAMSRFVPDTTGLPMLASTLESRRATVSERRSAARTGVHTLFVLTLVAGLGLALGRVIRHQIQVRRNMRAVMDEGIAAGEAIDAEGIERLARISHLYDLFLALFTVGMIAYGILVLLLRIRWEW